MGEFANLAWLLPSGEKSKSMKVFISLVLWSFLLVICWPLALIMLFLFPLVWLLLLPFKIVGLTIDLVFKLVGAVVLFPFRIFSKA
jgi:hypothetical protein